MALNKTIQSSAVNRVSKLVSNDGFRNIRTLRSDDGELIQEVQVSIMLVLSLVSRPSSCTFRIGKLNTVSYVFLLLFYTDVSHIRFVLILYCALYSKVWTVNIHV